MYANRYTGIAMVSSMERTQPMLALVKLVKGISWNPMYIRIKNRRDTFLLFISHLK